MCGIAAYFDLRQSRESREQIVRRMVAALHHRGPDAQGLWSDPDGGLTLGHRRLAILDLSAAGYQPMASASRRFEIVFNGEIYNHLELRRQLTGVAFRGSSDTETLLAALDRWGVVDTLPRLVGMFALAVWDQGERLLWLGRDRFGEKPLYYGCCERGFFCASELKAIPAGLGRTPALDRDALATYFRFGYLPSPFSIYQGFRKLPPGTFLRVQPGALPQLPEPTTYWSLSEAVAATPSAVRPASESESLEELESRLSLAVQGQMLADVPLGAFLSGGVDSSLIVALMQRSRPRPVRTFTIGFSEGPFDEARYAARIAAHLGTEHTEHYVTSSEALAVVPELATVFDEPFADSSQIPTLLVARLARRDVVVSLSGDGADELFGGYDRYAWAEKIWRGLSWLPPLLRRRLVAVGARLAAPSRAIGPPGWAPSWRRQKARLRRLAEVAAADSQSELYLRLIAVWDEVNSLVQNGSPYPTWFEHPPQLLQSLSWRARMAAQDALVYLPDDILVKVDRTAMSTGLETRVPLLDHRVAELVWGLPARMRCRPGQPKWALRQILRRYVPTELFERPKHGFGIPINEWLRGPLRDWAESMLDERLIRQTGYLNPAPVRQRWREHLNGARHGSSIWAVLMFQTWLAAQ